MPERSRHPGFEEVYPHIEFAPLVEFAMGLAKWIKRRFAGGKLDGADKNRMPATEA